MKKSQTDDDEMLEEYDFSNAPRGKYGPHYAADNIVLLEPDVAKVFRSSEAVNEALREVIASRKPAAKPKRGRTTVQA